MTKINSAASMNCMAQEKHEKLAAYLVDQKLSQEAFAKMLGVSQGAVHQWLTLETKITAERAVQIEAATNGKLTRYDCRPDLFYPMTAVG